MGHPDPHLAAPGWYPDPGGRGGQRWWDGHGWTSATRPAAPAPFQLRPRIGPDTSFWGEGPGSAERPQVPLVGLLVALAAMVVGTVADVSLQLVLRGVLRLPVIFVVAAGQAVLWTALVGACVGVSHRYLSGSIVDDFAWKLRWLDLLRGVCLGLIALILTATVAAPLSRNPRYRGSNTAILTRFRSSPAQLVVVAAIAIVGAPLVEELFFRGLIQGALLGRLGWWAVPLQSVLFASAHFQPLLGWHNVSVLVSVWVLGSVLGYSANYFGRLGPGVCAHAFQNTLATLVSVLR